MSAVYIDSIVKSFLGKLGINFPARIDLMPDHLFKPSSSSSEHSSIEIATLVIRRSHSVVASGNEAVNGIKYHHSILVGKCPQPIIFRGGTIRYVTTQAMFWPFRIDSKLSIPDMSIFCDCQSTDAEKILSSFPKSKFQLL